MKKLLIASFSAVAVMGLAACSDSGTDEMTTQSTVEETQPMTTQEETQAMPADEGMQSETMGETGATQPEDMDDMTLQPDDGETDDTVNSTTTEPAN
ncbi:hypothetical protein [Notoacmeibacter ruber]|uniref:Secreted protein n=1 Tax=Notoacmeibacter ruber TaxID=2670375 RepID=A0A3L7JCK0_9HYPH|nr:hypothetical protein [Notoacmeibacter ruber]RLQ88194.1 hypothetical protein D8780_08250 [Notoacmeibacter ruber]